MAKGAIHNIIRELAARGMGVLLISDEIPEVVNNCNRVLLMRSGRIRSEISTEGVQTGRGPEARGGGRRVSLQGRRTW